MEQTLVGYTGFVGGNLAAAHRFDALYNSKNISEAFSREHGLVVYAGVRAEKFLANRDPAADRARTEQALDNLLRMRPKKVVLISTADVYGTPAGVDENSAVETAGLHPYGLNRYLLEQAVQERFDALVVRLPALFGIGLKKNFLYDALTLTPSMLKPEKYRELAQKSDLVARCYADAGNGFYKLTPDAAAEQELLRAFFAANGWNALSFTDSRSVYQFYDLSRLWADIETALAADLRLLNLTSAPLTAAELYRACFGGAFRNELPSGPVSYDIRSVHAPLFGGADGYCYSREATLAALRRFCGEARA